MSYRWSCPPSYSAGGGRVFLDVGVSLLFVGIIDLAVLGALRRVIEEPSASTRDGGMAQLLAVMQDIDQRLAELTNGA